MMLNTGMITRDPNEVLDLYFRQCSVNVIRRDYAPTSCARTVAHAWERKVLAKEKARRLPCSRRKARCSSARPSSCAQATNWRRRKRVVVDFKRVHLADTSARKLIVRAARAMAGGETELVSRHRR